jgi:hypothetical protein
MNINWLDKHYATMGYRSLGVQLSVIICVIAATGNGSYTRAGLTYAFSTIVMGILMAMSCYSLNRMIVYLKRLQGDKPYIPEMVAKVKNEIWLQVLKYKIVPILALIIASGVAYRTKYGSDVVSLDDFMYAACTVQAFIILFLAATDPVNILDRLIEDEQT